MRDLVDYQKQYLKNNPFEPNMVRYRRNNTLKFINKYNPLSILEIGCADSPLFNYIDNFEKFILVEPIKLFCDKALAHASKNNNKKNIKIINDYFNSQLEITNKIDFIVCTGLLHEINNQKEFIRDVHKIAEENTIIHLNVPNSNSFHRKLALKAGIIKNLNEKSEFQKRFQQNHFFSMDELKRFVSNAGFNIIESGFITFKPFTHIQMQEIIDKKILSIEVIDALAEMVEVCPENGAEIYLNMIKKNI